MNKSFKIYTKKYLFIMVSCKSELMLSIMLCRFHRASFFRCRGLERTSKCSSVLFRASILTSLTFLCTVSASVYC